jgi:HlyD family secretion protein
MAENPTPILNKKLVPSPKLEVAPSQDSPPSVSRRSPQTFTRSEELQDILTAPPSWTTRWGSLVILIILIQLLVIAYFVKYPDIIKTTIVLTSESPTANIVSKSVGKIKLLVKDNQQVQAHALLGFIENAADFKDVQSVKKQLIEWKGYNLPKNGRISDHSYNLGTLQNTYGAVVKAYNNLATYLSLNASDKSIAEIEKLKNLHNDLRRNIDNQQVITQEEVKIWETTHKIDSILHQEQVLSESDFNARKGGLLPLSRIQENYAQELTNNSIRQQELATKIMETKIQQQEKLRDLQSEWQQSLDLLEAQIAEWEEQYLFKAPLSGKVSLFKFQTDNQNIAVGETLLSIVPKTTEAFGFLQLPMAKSGKAQVGQVVNIKCNSYPYEEYGLVKGRIASISEVPQNGIYTVRVSLDKGLMTTRHQKLVFKDLMDGSAEIITDDLRLLERLFAQILKILQ